MKALHTLLLASLFTGQAIAVDWQALPDTAPAPADNPTTEAKVELGKMLYMDPTVMKMQRWRQISFSQKAIG